MLNELQCMSPKKTVYATVLHGGLEREQVPFSMSLVIMYLRHKFISVNI